MAKIVHKKVKFESRTTGVTLKRSSVWLIGLSLMLVECGDYSRLEQTAVESQAPSDSTLANQVITELQGNTLKKKMTYPYLTVKFRQNDTEVEMMLDPKATNLDLELQRTPNGLVEVSKGDSVLLKKNKQSLPDSLKKPLTPGRHQYTDRLTDEVLEDIQLAQRLFYEERFEEALHILRSSLRKRETATAYALGGSIYYVHGDLDGALRAWQNALRINPELHQVRRFIDRHKN